MAERAESLSSSPYASSIHSQLSDDLSSILADSDDEGADSDISIDDEGVEGEEEDSDEEDDIDGEEDSNSDQEEEDDEDEDEDEDMNREDNYDDGDLDDFDLRRPGGLDDFDFDEFAFPGEADLADYLDFRQEEDQLGVLPHAFIYQLHNHLAQEQWGAHRHSPPPMDQGHARPGGQSGIRGDQLVEVEMVGQRNANAGQQRQRQRDPDVIDLTGDDDVAMPNQANSGPSHRPVQQGLQRPSENQRRLRSQPQNAPPRLNRSDGNYVDNQHVIVLSSSDDEELPLRASPGRNTRRNTHNNVVNINNSFRNINDRLPNNFRGNTLPNGRVRTPRLGEQPQQPGSASAAASAPAQAQNLFHPFTQIIHNLPLFQFLSNHQHPGMANRGHNHNHDDDDIVITAERNLANPPDAGQFLGINVGPIRLDYAAGQAFPIPVPPAPPGAAGGPRKPAHVPPKPARSGFTRDTGEDVVAICPSCDQELAYDPEGDDDENPPTRARKSRSKKASAEHHFWAVKACGHVYCKRCFENRRPSAKSGIQVGFRPDSAGTKKLLCAVEDCDSDVSSKVAWVGIFM